MKAKVEWKENDCWKQANVELKTSRNGNYYFTYDGAVYVFASLKEKTRVVIKTKDGWVLAGRVTRGSIFLGEGESYSETMERNFKGETKFERPIFT